MSSYSIDNSGLCNDLCTTLGKLIFCLRASAYFLLPASTSLHLFKAFPLHSNLSFTTSWPSASTTSPLLFFPETGQALLRCIQFYTCALEHPCITLILHTAVTLRHSYPALFLEHLFMPDIKREIWKDEKLDESVREINGDEHKYMSRLVAQNELNGEAHLGS